MWNYISINKKEKQIVPIGTYIFYLQNVIIFCMKNKHAEKTTVKLAKLLKEKRIAMGISHQTLADKAGINRSTISRIESGDRIPTITVCLKIAEALDCKLYNLLQEIE